MIVSTFFISPTYSDTPISFFLSTCTSPDVLSISFIDVCTTTLLSSTGPSGTGSVFYKVPHSPTFLSPSLIASSPFFTMLPVPVLSYSPFGVPTSSSHNRIIVLALFVLTNPLLSIGWTNISLPKAQTLSILPTPGSLAVYDGLWSTTNSSTFLSFLGMLSYKVRRCKVHTYDCSFEYTSQLALIHSARTKWLSLCQLGEREREGKVLVV